MFMLGDCLLEGTGCPREPGRAVAFLYAAAETGHRGARQHIRQLLDGTWHGFRGRADVSPVF
jgi:TPR repeat protein